MTAREKNTTLFQARQNPKNGFSSAFPNPMQEEGNGLANPVHHQPQGRLSSDERAKGGVDDD